MEAVKQAGSLPQFLTVKQVAEFVNCSTTTVWRAIWSGDLPSTRLTGKTVRVSRRQLESWLRRKEGLA
jgi:excisionase family DNA binding protein